MIAKARLLRKIIMVSYPRPFLLVQSYLSHLLPLLPHPVRAVPALDGRLLRLLLARLLARLVKPTLERETKLSAPIWPPQVGDGRLQAASGWPELH